MLTERYVTTWVFSGSDSTLHLWARQLLIRLQCNSPVDSWRGCLYVGTFCRLEILVKTHSEKSWQEGEMGGRELGGGGAWKDCPLQKRFLVSRSEQVVYACSLRCRRADRSVLCERVWLCADCSTLHSCFVLAVESETVRRTDGFWSSRVLVQILFSKVCCICSVLVWSLMDW